MQIKMSVGTAFLIAVLLVSAVMIVTTLITREIERSHMKFRVWAQSAGKKIHLYIDMDGCLAKWQNVSIETLYKKGYFASLDPDEKLIRVLQRADETFKDSVEERICSHYLTGTAAGEEKREWLHRFARHIEDRNVVLVPYTEDKDTYVTNDGSVVNVLIDDYTQNLKKWEAAGNVAIKYMNGINGTKGTWKGLRLDGNMDEESMYLSLAGMLLALQRGGSVCASL